MDFFIAKVVDFPPTRTLTAVSVPTFRFMDLPPELRVKVYEELVVVGRVFYTPECCETTESCLFGNLAKFPCPDLSILRASRATHEEAGHVYLGKNCFVMPSRWSTFLPFYRGPDKRRHIFSRMAFEKAKHIAVVLFPRTGSYPLTMNHTDWDDHEFETGVTFESMTKRERMKLAHSNSLTWTLDYYEEVFEMLLEFKNLQVIELDFTGAYCAHGCCRVVSVDWEGLIGHASRFRIHGIRTTVESEVIKEAWSEVTQLTPEEIDHILEIHIIGTEDSEAET
ncbi:hypothetical protein E8E13_003195 [Curvularia kusanoi]|uniref:Uncharacterized protein n=1 Tax=Curvularia kusanoi TaxID=90978 RepID=A0A9P4TDZ1_CURKU|nr:hypothetical protein E8E13_003195 [Curvularia kusanoi]